MLVTIMNNEHAFISGFFANNKFIPQLLFQSSGGPSILNHNPATTFRRSYSKNPNLAPLSEKSHIKLNPWWVTGFIDGEGCFILSIYKDPRQKTGWRVQLSFKIALHLKDRAILEMIKNFLGVGQIYSHGSNSVELRVQSIKELAKIFEHLEKYLLITKKLADYKLLKQAYDLMLNNEHLKKEGLRKFVGIKASMNSGLSPD